MKALWKYLKGLPVKFEIILTVRLLGLAVNVVLLIMVKSIGSIINLALWAFLLSMCFFKCCPSPTGRIKCTEIEEKVIRYMAKNENATYKECAHDLNMSESSVSNTLRRARDRNGFCKSADLINTYRRNNEN